MGQYSGTQQGRGVQNNKGQRKVTTTEGKREKRKEISKIIFGIKAKIVNKKQKQRKVERGNELQTLLFKTFYV